jgi:hypothetical protein
MAFGAGALLFAVSIEMFAAGKFFFSPSSDWSWSIPPQFSFFLQYFPFLFFGYAIVFHDHVVLHIRIHMIMNEKRFARDG